MGFFRQVKASFTNFGAYSDFAAQRTRKTFKYFFILFTLIFLVWLVRFAYAFNSGATELVTTVKEKIPEFRLTGGQLTVDTPQPMIIDGNNQTALIIDTTGQTDQSVLDQFTDGVFISRDKVFSKQGMQKKEISFADFPQVKLDKQKLLEYLPLAKWLLGIIALLGYILGAAWVLITTVILALIGLLINSSIKGKLLFGNMWNMAVYASTLPWLLETVKNQVYPLVPSFWIIKWGLATFLLYKGIEAANKPTDPLDPQLPPGASVL